MLFDTHAHLNDPAFDPDREELMASFADAGVGLVMNAGCSLESSRDIVQMAEKYPQYGFEIHKGYGTKAHYEALTAHGPSPIHRMTFLKKFYGEK